MHTCAIEPGLQAHARQCPPTGGRRSWRRVLLALFALAMTLSHAQLAHADTVTVRIGSAEPMSGPLAAVGQDNTNAVRMAIDELNDRALRIGGKRVVWVLDAQDDQGDPKQATMVAQKFVDQKVNAVVGHATSGSTSPAAAIYARAAIPQITPASTDTAIARRGHATFFRMLADDEALGSGLAQYAARQLQLGTVVVIDDRTAYGQGLADAFARAAQASGIRVLAREYTNNQAVDFTAVLTRAHALRPDAVFYGGTYAQGGPMLRQMRRLGMKARYIGGDASCMPAMADIAGDAVDGALCAESGLPLHDMPQGREWARRYHERFGDTTIQAFSPYAYDATMVLAAAMLKADSTDPRKYLAYVRHIGHDGVTKKNIRFTPQGNLVEPMVSVEVFEGRQRKVIAVQQAH